MKGLAAADRQSAEAMHPGPIRTILRRRHSGNNDQVVWNRKAKADTRLGEATIDIDIKPAEKGPFGNDVDQLSIPHWMIDAEPGRPRGR